MIAAARSLLFVVFFLPLCATIARSQQRPPADTARADTLRTPGDTAGAPVIADSVYPIPQLAAHYHGPVNGFTNGVWFWDRDALLDEAAITVGDLLRRIPSVLLLRSGLFLQPEAASAFGSTGGRVEVVLDGYVLDPLLFSTFDISELELAEVASVRVERRLGLIRIHIATLVAADNRAHSMVMAGTGRPPANVFRGLFLAPRLFFGPIGLAIDRVDTDGNNRNEPADQSSAWVKWSWVRNGSGLQIEYRRAGTDRDPNVPWPARHTRNDIVLRARAQLLPGLLAELYGGRSEFENDTVVDPPEDEPRVPALEADNTQWGGRLSVATPFFWADGALRFRDAAGLPSHQIDGVVGVRHGGTVAAAAEVTQANWRSSGNALSYTLRGEAGLSVVRVFGEWTAGERGVPYVRAANAGGAAITEYTGWRAGAQAELRGFMLAGALLHSETDSIPTFGLPFDQTPLLYAGGDADGWEVTARVPLYFPGLVAQGSVTNWYSGSLWAYLPTRHWRAGLELHTTPLASGNLEILGRLEVIQRGSMLAPDHDVSATAPPLVVLPADNYIDAYLQIRVIDVRLFGHFEDIMGQDPLVLPGRTIRGPRMFYGVTWQFFN